MNVDLMEKQFIIASACGKYGDQNVAERLLKLLESKAELDGQVFGRILYALAELRATNAASYLLNRFKQKKNEWILIRLQNARALIELGEKSVAPELMNMLTNEKLSDTENIEVLELVGSSGDKSVAPLLLNMLLAETTSTIIKPAIAHALRNIKESSLVGDILEHLQDETIDWEIQWLLTESLEGLQEIAIASLRSMLQNPNININKRVRVGITATLGTWGDQESISHLHEAIESRVVPPNWCLGDSIWIGYIWQRITRTLKSLGDKSVVPTLLQALGQNPANHVVATVSSPWFIVDYKNRLFTWATKYNTSVCEARGIILAALEYESDVIAQQVQSILRQSGWHLSQNELLYSLPKLTSKSLVPELLVLLAERQRDAALNWVRGIVRSIGELGDDCKTVRALLDTGSSLSSKEVDYLKPAIYTALYSVSRRARVRVSRDEQIEELP
jgi:HEAT repeat protein